MSKVYFVLITVLISSYVFPQSPDKMSYQAIVRDSNNDLIQNKQVGMQISIMHGEDASTNRSVYSEVHLPITNSNGLVSIEIGTGNTIDDFSIIDWANGPYFIKTEIDLDGGINYTITSTSQLLSVPYALYAKEAGKSSCISVKAVEVFTGNSTNEWSELDLSKVVGENYAIVTLRVKNESSTIGLMSLFRQKGDQNDYDIGSATSNSVSLGYSGVGHAITYTDEEGAIEWKSSDITPVTLEVVAICR